MREYAVGGTPFVVVALPNKLVVKCNGKEFVIYEE